MRIAEMNWMMVEEYLTRDDRCVLPLGSTEQHAYLSLSVDSILAERLALEAAEPLGVPVFPVLAYGITPYFRAFPGTITLRVQTYFSILRDWSLQRNKLKDRDDDTSSPKATIPVDRTKAASRSERKALSVTR